MKRKAFVQAYFGRLAAALLLLCLIIYTVYHAVGNSAGGLITSAAREITDNRLLGGEARLFREETLLYAPHEGLVNSIAESGEKVSKNAPLVDIWVDSNHTDTAQKQVQLDALNKTVALLKNSLLPAGSNATHAEGYRTEALGTLQKIREAVAKNNWSALSELETRMLTSLNRYGALTGQEGAVEAALAKAESDRNAMLTGICNTVYNQRASAYYYDRSCVDGYEGSYTKEALDSLTPEGFSALCEAEPSFEADKFTVGKLAYDYAWYIALSLEGAENFLQAGVFYPVRFPESHGEELNLLCEKLLVGEGQTTVAVFRSDVNPDNFRYLRVQRVEITVGSISGYHIPRQALTLQNGVLGVYVFDESTVRFRRISQLYEGEGYVIADFNDPEPNHEILYLSPNDLIVTSGKNLYDGKVYR